MHVVAGQTGARACSTSTSRWVAWPMQTLPRVLSASSRL
jgi:hypothetical protein